jgi:soluble lytic murein transglycosylase-like protein/TolA-binding protein
VNVTKILIASLIGSLIIGPVGVNGQLPWDALLDPLADGKRWFSESNYTLALLAFSEACRWEISSERRSMGQVWLIRTYVQLREYEKAVQEFNELKEDQPQAQQLPTLSQEIGQLAFSTGRYAQALEFLRSSKRDSGLREDLLAFQLAECHRQLGDWDEALWEFRLAVEKSFPDIDTIVRRMSWITLKQRRCHEFDDLLVFAREHSLSPSTIRHLTLNRAQCLQQDGKWAEALPLWKDLARTSSSNLPEIRYYLGRGNERQGNAKEAARFYRLVIRNHPESSFASTAIERLKKLGHIPASDLYHVGRVRYYEGDYQRALANLNIYLEHHPHHADAPAARLLRAQTYARLGKHRTAAREYRRHAERYGKTYEAAKALHRSARELERAGDIERAMETYLDAHRASPGSNPSQASLYDLARLHEKQGNLDQASEEYRRLIETTHTGSYRYKAWLRMALNAYRAGDIGKAEQILLRFPSHTKEYLAASSYWRGRCLEALDHWDEALQAYHSAIAADPLGYYAWLARDRRGDKREDLSELVDTLGLHTWLYHWTDIEPDPPGEQENNGETVIMAGLLADLRTDGGPYELAMRIEWLKRAAQDRKALSLASRLLSQAMESGPQRIPPELLRLLYPSSYQLAVTDIAGELSLNPLLLMAMARQESAFDPQAVSSAGARGLMQLMPQTASQVGRSLGMSRGSRDGLNDPELNIRLGATYLRELLELFDWHVEMALAGYNAGPHRVDRWLAEGTVSNRSMELFIEDIPFVETRDYVKKVIANLRIYQLLSQIP